MIVFQIFVQVFFQILFRPVPVPTERTSTRSVPATWVMASPVRALITLNPLPRVHKPPVLVGGASAGDQPDAGHQATGFGDAQAGPHAAWCPPDGDHGGVVDRSPDVEVLPPVERRGDRHQRGFHWSGSSRW